jgi:tRNA A37 methylthiotransferase MiaB
MTSATQNPYVPRHIMALTLPTPPKIGMVSLGCPKALVDSERILTKLRADGYGLSPDYEGADVVLVNTCGFLDSAPRKRASRRSARPSPRMAA